MGEAFEILARCLGPFVERHMSQGQGGGADWAARFAATARPPISEFSTEDPAFLLRVVADCWRGTFERQLPRSARNIVFALRDKRNDWAHNKRFRLNDTQYTLSAIVSLIEAVAPQDAPEVEQLQHDLNRIEYERAHEMPSRATSRAPFSTCSTQRRGA